MTWVSVLSSAGDEDSRQCFQIVVCAIKGKSGQPKLSDEMLVVCRARTAGNALQIVTFFLAHFRLKCKL